MLNSLSHELRTPISTIIGAVDVLLENRDGISPSNQRELLNQINIASIRLNTQVENLLNMSRLESGHLKLNNDWCDTNELIHDVIHQSVQSKNQSIVFEPIDHLPLFKYDRGLMEQILLNLIQNALNYTPNDAVIEIEAKLINGHCLITIADNGNGIAANERLLIFDKFYRIPHTKTGGSGLGLSIVKGFVEAQNGSISVTNNSKGGATFTLEFPFEASYINNLKNE